VTGIRLGHKNMRLVRLAIAVGIRQHHDGLAVGHSSSLVVVDSLGQPDATLRTDIHGYRRKEQWRLGPHLHFKILAKLRIQLERRQWNLFQSPLLFTERYPVGQLGVSGGERQQTSNEQGQRELEHAGM